MPTDTVYAIEIECEDAFYGYHVDELFWLLEDAEKRLAELEKMNPGCTYQITEWRVQ